jgi:NAD(P)-dependent dehydrogenase (short-subunit alcohol dehydrogenase family)
MQFNAMITLENKTAIVTGAAHGIGKAIAAMFDRAGATVSLLDIDDAAGTLAAAELTGARFIHCDVASVADVQRAIDETASTTGAVDILCNNAAFLGSAHALLESTDEEWEKCFRVSLLGAQNCTRAVLPYMLRRRNGSVINISSIQGIAAARNSAAYTSIKHAIVGLTRSVAYDYGPDNIRVNAICPGAIRTRTSPPIGSELHQRQIGKTFLGRTGEVDEIAWAALFLASDAASYITGIVLPVDGGWTAM